MRQTLLIRILAYAALALSVILTGCTREKMGASSPLKALSTQSAVILETGHYPSMQSALAQNKWMETVQNDPAWKHFYNDLSPLVKNLDSLEDLLGNRRLFFSVELTGKGKYGVLAATEMKDNIWSKLQNKLQSAGKHHVYSERDIFEITANERAMFVSFSDGVLLCSAEKILVEDGLRRLGSEYTLDVNPGFKRIRATANPKDHFNIYAQYREWPAFVKGILGETQTDFLEEVSSWTALDIHLTSRDVLFSGLSDLGDSLPAYLDVFSGQKPQKIQSGRVVPISSAMWINYSVSNFLKHHRQFDQYRKSKGVDRRYAEQLARFEVDFEAAFLRWIDREYGVIWLASKQNPRNKRVAYFEVRDENEFLKAFEPLTDAEYLQVFRNQKVYRSNQVNWMRALLGKTFNGLEARYFWIYDNYVFFAAAEDILNDLMNDVLDERTLSQSLQYRQFSAKIPDRASVQVTLMSKEGESLLMDVFPPKWKAFLKRNNDLLEHTPYVSLQFQVQDKMAYTGMYAAFQSEVEQIVKPVWSAEVPAKVVAGPFLLKNHYNNQKEIAVQDENNVLYLYSTAGVLLWKRELTGPILGEIEQVDLFRNGKLQLAFATKTHIEILDRNGNTVTPFPKKASGEITAPLGVFDYDKSRNYRFVFACGEKVYNWDKDGKDVKGWELSKVEGNVIRQPEHWVAGSKDYLVFITDKNKAYLTDRRGVVRVSQVLSLPENNTSPYNVQVNVEEKTIQLTALTFDGKILNVLSSGKTDEVSPGRLPDRAMMQLRGEQMLIFGENKVMLKDPIRPLEVSLDQLVSGEPKVCVRKNDLFLVVAGSNNQLFVYDQQGKIISGFPVYGTHLMAIDHLYPSPSMYLISITPEHKIVVYLIQ